MNDPFQFYIRAADEHGRFTFSTAEQKWLKRDAGISLRQYGWEQVRSRMDTFRGFSHVFERVAARIKDLDIQLTSIPGTSDYQVSFSLVRLVGLPGLNPKAELKEFDDLLESWKPFFVKHALERPLAMVTNNRDRNRKTYGELSFRFKAEGADMHSGADEFSSDMMAKIQASPVLSHQLHWMALSLNKLGPWSWSTFTGEHLFEFEDDPVWAARKLHASQNPVAPAQGPKEERVILDV